MRSCLVAYVSTFKRGGCSTFAKWRNLKSELLSRTSVRKEYIPRKFMKTSWKPFDFTVPPFSLPVHVRIRPLLQYWFLMLNS